MENSKLEWRVEKRQVKDLLNWKRNPRKISTGAFLKLKERITERGFHDVIKIDTDNTVLSGNQRKKALIDLKIDEVTVLIPNRALTDEERNKVALESNVNDGDWNFEALKDFNIDMLLDIGFDQIDLDSCWKDILETKEEDFNINEEIAKIKIPETKLGDIILLGSHKLLCGDSTKHENLKKLFGEEKASMVYSDSVYNIKIDYSNGISGKQNYGGNVNDNRSEEEYKSFLKMSLECALSITQDDAHIFYWSDQSYIWLIQTLYKELGIENKRVCMWIKNSQNPTPGVAFNKCYEPCTYGVRGKPYLSKDIRNANEIMNKELTTGNNLLSEINDQLDLWLVPRLSGKEYEHATSKPPALHEKAIRRCTKPGDIILDSFSGSGSTIIAGEQLKRKVYAVELEPLFCDLTIRRFEKLTGKKAIVIRDNEKA